MVKTTVYLPEDLKDSLSQWADEVDSSEAELIREAIRNAVASRTPPRPRLPLVSQGLGDPSVAERVDEHLEGFGSS